VGRILLEHDMSDPFVAEIRIFLFNFAPATGRQLLPISSQNTALLRCSAPFYGGDGKSTFACPICRALLRPAARGAGLQSGSSASSQGSSVTPVTFALDSEMPGAQSLRSARPSANGNGQWRPNGQRLQGFAGNLQASNVAENVQHHRLAAAQCQYEPAGAQRRKQPSAQQI